MGNFRNYTSADSIMAALPEARSYAQQEYLREWRAVEDLAHRKCAWFARNRTPEREAKYRFENTACVLRDMKNHIQRQTAMFILDTLEEFANRVPEGQTHHRTIRLLNCEWDFIHPFMKD